MKITRTAVVLDYEGDQIVIAACGIDSLRRALRRFQIRLNDGCVESVQITKNNRKKV